MDKTVWDNSDELRHSVERDLDNWGAWSRQGNRVNLGHPSQIPGATPPERDPPPVTNVELAEATEYVISTWCSASDSGKHGAFLLKTKYVERQPLEAIALHYRRKFKTNHSDNTVEAMLDEAEWFFFLLTA